MGRHIARCMEVRAKNLAEPLTKKKAGRITCVDLVLDRSKSDGFSLKNLTTEFEL